MADGDQSWSRRLADPDRPCTKCGRTKADGARFRFKSAPSHMRHSACVDCTNAYSRVWLRKYRQEAKEGLRIPMERAL